jgi:type VI protein secretion system component Hcp
MADSPAIDAHMSFCWPGVKRAPKAPFWGESWDKIAEEIYGDGNWTWPSVLSGYSLGATITDDWVQEEAPESSDDTFQSKPHMADATINKMFDMSSPTLYEALCRVTLFDRVKIVHRRVGGSSKDHFKIKLLIVQMRLVVVKDIKWEADESGRISETLTLTHHGLDLQYVPQQPKGGTDDPNSTDASWPGDPAKMDDPADPDGPIWHYFHQVHADNGSGDGGGSTGKGDGKGGSGGDKAEIAKLIKEINRLKTEFGRRGR